MEKFVKQGCMYPVCHAIIRLMVLFFSYLSENKKVMGTADAQRWVHFTVQHHTGADDLDILGPLVPTGDTAELFGGSPVAAAKPVY